MAERLGGYAADVRLSEARETTLCARICPVQLSPGLLEDADPDLTIAAGSKCRLSTPFNWQVIIHDDWSLHTVDVEDNHVDAGGIDLLRDEDASDAIFKFGQRAERRQEVTVA